MLCIRDECFKNRFRDAMTTKDIFRLIASFSNPKTKSFKLEFTKMLKKLYR